MVIDDIIFISLAMLLILTWGIASLQDQIVYFFVGKNRKRKSGKIEILWKKRYDNKFSSIIHYITSSMNDWDIKLTGDNHNWYCNLCGYDFNNQEDFEKWFTKNFLTDLIILLKKTSSKEMFWRQRDPHFWESKITILDKNYRFILSHDMNAVIDKRWCLKFMNLCYYYKDSDLAKVDLSNRIEHIISQLQKIKRETLVEKTIG